MTGYDRLVDVDRFAASIESILGEYGAEVERRVPMAAERAGKVGVKAVKRNVKSSGIGGTGKYARSWGMKANRRGKTCAVEIGSTMPGLPHLLEKGHATLGGGRTRAYPHIAPAADETFEEFERAVSDEIGGI